MSQKKLALCLTLMLLAFAPFASGTTSVTLPTNWYGGIPTESTYITFSTLQTFDEVYREDEYWYFDGYGVHVASANLTFTQFVEDYAPDVMQFTLSGSGTVNICCGRTVSSVSGASSWSHNSDTGNLTVTATTATVVVTYEPAPSDGGGGGGGGGLPTKTYLSLFSKYENLTYSAGDYVILRGYLADMSNQRLGSKTVSVTKSWNSSASPQEVATNLNGEFEYTLRMPLEDGYYTILFKFFGDPQYAACMLTSAVTVLGGQVTIKPVFPEDINIPLLLLILGGGFVLIMLLRKRRR